MKIVLGCAVGLFAVTASATGVVDVLGEFRQLQGNDKDHNAYTEIHDRALNRIMELDRKVDAEWVEAAKDASAFKAKQAATRAAWIDSLGGFPEKCPLNVKVTGVVKRDGYRIEKVMFESRPNHHVTATVFVPEDAKFKAPYPAVAVACGHSVQGKMIPNYQRPGVIGAKNGFVVMTYDPIDQGERYQRTDADAWKFNTVFGHNHAGHRAMLLGWNTAQFRIWDGIRAIDVLCEREDVDSNRIAVTGHSGGGTESSYLMAIDERVKAACPSGFITSLRELDYLCGPQDAEQKFFNQLGFGLNHLGILMLRGDRCAEMPLTTHADFFPFMGATDTRDKARVAFAALGRSDCFDFINASGPHLWPESSMQAEFRWFRKWLKGEREAWNGYDPIEAQKVNFGFSYDDPKVDVGLAREKNNTVTPKGQVTSLEGERTVYDIMRDELGRLDGQRAELTREKVAAIAGIRTDGVTVDLLNRCEYELEYEGGKAKAEYAIIYRNDDGTPLPIYAFRPAAANGEALIIVSDRVKMQELEPKVTAALKAGRPVAVLCLRQFGLTGQVYRRHGEITWNEGKFYGISSPDEMTAVMLELLGESLVGRRAEDLMLALAPAADLLGAKGRFELMAEGRAAIPAAHAYYLAKEKFSAFSMSSEPPSYRKLLEDDFAKSCFADVVHGALRAYDWVDLVK